MTRRVRGFTLVELTIVLVIVSLLFGMGMSLLMAQMTNSRYAETKVKQEAIKQALTAFISRNNRLPCPANPTLMPGTALYGTEAASPGACNGIASFGAGASAVVTGIVPWVSIGLPEDIATDGFFSRFTYQAALAATGLNSQTVSGMQGVISLHSAGPGTMLAAPVGNQINDCSAGLANNPCAAAAVIVSHGRNTYGAHLIGGNRSPTAGSGADEIANTDDDSRFVKRDFSESAGNPFDDVILAMTASDLLSPLTQNGTLKDARAALAATFLAMRGSIEAAAISARLPGASPGQASFPLPPSASATNDPWGKQLIYARNASVVTSSTPAGLAYTLSSAGPDGAYGTADDIHLAVSVADLQSIFARTGF